jgi:Carboxypeptidase regulatory-like domain
VNRLRIFNPGEVSSVKMQSPPSTLPKQKSSVRGRLVIGLLFFQLLAFAFYCPGQSPDGELVGLVQDSTGARLPSATIGADALGFTLSRTTTSNRVGEFRLGPLPPGKYRVHCDLKGWESVVFPQVDVPVGTPRNVSVVMQLQTVRQTVQVRESNPRALDATTNVEKAVVDGREIADMPLAARSFANIAYIAPMTAPVEPSDPTKARITAVSFAGSSGLNVDLSVDGGDNNDDYIGGFLQNYSPDAMQEFVVRTAQYDADTSRTNGGSVIIVTRRGTNQWHGGGSFYERAAGLNARNPLDNPEPNPKAPFSRQNGTLDLGGAIKPEKVWFFSSLELVRENASVSYGAQNLSEFDALAQLAARGQIPGVSSIRVPTSTPVPFRDQLFDSRIDWNESQRAQWFFRGAFDLNHTKNNLVQQGTLPSTGVTTNAHYYSFLANQQFLINPRWLGSFTFQAGTFTNHQTRNSNLGMALAFPFSSTIITTSGFETFGDNQFATGITAFPVYRAQEKYQFRYDVTRYDPDQSVKFGVNFIHEPVLSGRLADTAEQLVEFPENPSFYLAHGQSILPIIQSTPVTPAFDGGFSQNVQRLGLYFQDAWRARPNFTVNLGMRYDTTFGLFTAEGQNQNQNPAVQTLRALGIPLAPGVPHDYRGALAPRVGLVYSPGGAGKTVIRAGVGLYYNDLAQSGWVQAFQSVNTPFNGGLLGPNDAGAVISPDYHSPYDFQASAGIEHQFNPAWDLTVQFEHHKGVHQYRAYEYAPGFTLPAAAPFIDLYRTDNRSRYDGASVLIHHHAARLDLTAHYTLSSAATWGAVVGELFDYVNQVSDVRNAFGPGDYGPAGEDMRHRFVLAAEWNLPHGFQVSTLGQAESARPFTMVTPVDVNNDGVDDNDRAVVNGVQTKLDQFRGVPYFQADMRVSRDFNFSDKVSVRPFVEFFNLFNRVNPGNNFLPDISAMPTPVNDLTNATAFCINADCTQTSPIRSLNDLRVPAGALGDFFGPGTTVGIPFAAQIGVRITF